MKWSFVIQQKLKAALLLGGVMVLIIIGNLLSRNQIEGIDKSFSSIYQDRLIPATTITYLAENLYRKRLHLERLLLSKDSTMSGSTLHQLKELNGSIDSLIHVFEKTYLVDKEVKSLSAFKNRVQEYALLEKMVLNLYLTGNGEEGRLLFEGTGSDTFQSTINRLNELTSIQSDVGRELVKESQSSIAGFSMLSFLQIALVVVIGLMVLMLIQSARIVNSPKRAIKDKDERFHLN